MAGGIRSFTLILQKEGLFPLQTIVTSHDNILGMLRTAIAGRDPRCRVDTLDVVRSAGYSVALSLRHAGDIPSLHLTQAVHSAMRSLLPDEKLRAAVSIRRLWHSRPGHGLYGKALISFHLLFAGEQWRLAEIFPPAMQRKLWKRSKPWKARPPASVMPLSAIDAILPSPNETWMIRGGFPPGHGDVVLEGINVVTASGRHRLFVGEDFLRGNTLVFGGTGSGKSSVLQHLALALIRQGRPVCVIDPHGTLAISIMGSRGNRIDEGRLLMIDPVLTPLGINPFEVFRSCGETQEVSSLLVESIGHSVREAFGKEYWGPRLEYLLKGMIGAVAPLPESNFVDVMELINNPFASKELADTTPEGNTRNFLLSIVPKAKDEWWMSTIDKIGRIIDDRHCRSLLCRRKGNLDIGACIREGITIVANLDMNRIGAGVSSLVGAMLISAYWILASSARSGATILIDEAQLYPADIIGRIASQGRKFGVNVVFATQSPSVFGRSTLASLGSNFENKILLHLDEMDARIASEFAGDISPEDITGLEPLSAIIRSRGSTGLLSVDVPAPSPFDLGAYAGAVGECYSTTDDAFPSPLSSLEGQLFDVLQITRMAENQGKQSISGIEETGALTLLGYGASEMSTLIERARSMSLVQKAHLKLSQSGRNELLRLQGGMLAGNSEHRSMVLAVKDIFDSMHMLTYIPRQRLGREQPDLIVKTPGSISSTLLYVEVEVATRYQLDKRRKKIERAVRNNAVPVFVFNEEGPVISALRGGEFRESLFLALKGSALMSYNSGSWTEMSSASELGRLAMRCNGPA